MRRADEVIAFILTTAIFASVFAFMAQIALLGIETAPAWMHLGEIRALLQMGGD